jgi:hypothetical protein
VEPERRRLRELFLKTHFLALVSGLFLRLLIDRKSWSFEARPCLLLRQSKSIDQLITPSKTVEEALKVIIPLAIKQRKEKVNLSDYPVFQQTVNEEDADRRCTSKLQTDGQYV